MMHAKHKSITKPNSFMKGLETSGVIRNCLTMGIELNESRMWKQQLRGILPLWLTLLFFYNHSLYKTTFFYWQNRYPSIFQLETYTGAKKITDIKISGKYRGPFNC